MSDLSFLFQPNAVAVIGASAAPQKIGYAIVSNLIKSGYKGKIYPINPKEKEILGLPCHPAVGKVKGQVDLAVIAVPARFSVQAVSYTHLDVYKRQM